MKTVNDFNFENKKALIRVDFNVPLNDNLEVADSTRILAAKSTIIKVLEDGGSCVLMSHLGRPKNGPENKFSLKHLVPHLKKMTGTDVVFSDNCISLDAINTSKSLKSGTIHLLENLRFYPEETAGNNEFARALSKHGDVYINDAFGTAHRSHASTAVIANHFQDKCFGSLMAKEIKNASMLLEKPKRPFTAIVGGAKVSDKILIIQNLLNIADHIIIGGGMAYTFKYAQGGKIGDSLFEEDRVATCLEILKEAEEKDIQIHLPGDSVIADKFDNNATTENCQSDQITEGWMGLDIGENAVKKFTSVLASSKTILWNGPLGVFELSAFENGTKSIAKAVSEATQNGAFSLIGGGDSSAAVKKFGYTQKVSYVSTGGGALLEYFEGKKLPGIVAIEG